MLPTNLIGKGRTTGGSISQSIQVNRYGNDIEYKRYLSKFEKMQLEIQAHN